MISFGTNIKDTSTNLIKIDLDKIYKAILNPKEETKQQILNLRNVLSIDINKYKNLKVNLPYICCANFNPPIRKNINFAFTQYFIIDVDHILSKQLNIETIKSRLTTDKRVVLMFNSPSNDGLKIMFKLCEKCYDAGKYSLFYKLFTSNFSKQYGLEQVVDSKTSDVSRACFVSHDTNAYYNNKAECIKMESIINFNNNLEVENANLLFSEFKKQDNNNLDNTQKDKNIPQDIFAEIKQKLSNKQKQTKPEKIIYIPEELNEILDKIKKELLEFTIKIEEITNIHYGKKIKVNSKNTWAEINVFYGKRGFSVVKTPKRGSNIELCNLSAEIIENVLF